MHNVLGYLGPIVITSTDRQMFNINVCVYERLQKYMTSVHGILSTNGQASHCDPVSPCDRVGKLGSIYTELQRQCSDVASDIIRIKFL